MSKDNVVVGFVGLGTMGRHASARAVGSIRRHPAAVSGAETV
jgi:hypothetical protein